MTLEITVFIASILFGMLLYWRESTGNGLYRFFNKLMYSKRLQMSKDDPTGFLYQQKFILRLVFISMLFLFGIAIVRLLIPIDLATISLFLSCIFGTLLGSYIGGFIIKSEKVIDAQADLMEEKLDKAIGQGKKLVHDLKDVQPENTEPIDLKTTTNTEPQEKSARQRLKDKGFLK